MKLSIQQNAFEYAICKMSAILGGLVVHVEMLPPIKVQYLPWGNAVEMSSGDNMWHVYTKSTWLHSELLSLHHFKSIQLLSVCDTRIPIIIN